MKLYELTEQYATLEEWLDEGADEETTLDTLELVEEDYNEKIENYCKLIKNTEAEAKALKEEADRLNARAKTKKNKIDWLKHLMEESMRATGKKEAGGTILKAKIQKNGGKLPLIVDEDNVPVTYQKIEYKTDNDAIRKALDEGEDLDFAKYGERGESLRIK